MPYMIIERIGSCNDCDLCSERRVVLPSALICGIGTTLIMATPSPQYRVCSIRFRIKEWDFVNPIPDADIIGIKFANPITITSGDRDIWPDEIRIDMTGNCNKCGFCCGWRANKLIEYGCSHIITTGNKKGECSIYESLGDYCPQHGFNHAECIPPQDMPTRLYNDSCGYQFIVATPGLPITGNEVLRLYAVPSNHIMGPDAWCRD